jgi:RNA-directed DNA polymerase
MGLMDMEKQQGNQDSNREPLHHGEDGDGGTGTILLEARQMSTAPVPARALTVNLMEQVCEPKNLVRAYRRVRANKGKPGVDGMTVLELADWLRENQAALTASLLDGTYQPQPVRGVQIPKPGGGQRQLGIPTVVDRLVQQAILQVVEPIFDPTFSESSFGFRPGRSAHQALEQGRKYVASGREIVVDLDLEKFFDQVNHDILMSRLARRIEDKRLLRLIRRFLQAGLMQDGVCLDRKEGTPQGGPLSPILANLLLDDLDKELESRGHCFCRYADDCNIYVRSQAAGERVMESVTRFLEEKLRLRVNRNKSAVAPDQERKFLGYRLLGNGKLGIAPKSLERAREKIRQITQRNRGVSFQQVIEELNSFLNGWLNYFRYAAFRFDLKCLEEWIRRKLRCYRLKQRKRGSSFSSFLQRLGVPAFQAARLAGSGKGWWRLAISPQTKQAMPIGWFAKQGLLNLLDRYDALHT